jgi:primosomal protein N' (replication factor Y)
VPFRNRSLIGVVLERSGSVSAASTPKKLKDVTQVLDPHPALLPRLLELGHWVANYYLAPVGETFRSMLPPAVKLRAPRMQIIIALNAGARTVAAPNREAAGTRTKTETKRAAAEASVQTLLAERGPLPLPQLVKLAGVSRNVVNRLVQQGQLRQWEEPAATETIFEAEFDAPSNVLNEDQERAFAEISTWLDAANFTVGLLYGVTGSGKTEVYLRAVAETLSRGRNA